MARVVRLRHRQSGIEKRGFYGFSWTSFLFGGFPALLRGDLWYGIGVLGVGIAFGLVSAGFLWFVVSVIWAFVYNRNYTHRLLESGYELADTPERNEKARQALGIVT
ncbi:MAG: hypothetical protein AB1635_05200 [Acidobacteriota bacterium]